MGKRVLFIVMVVVGLLLIVNNHLHYTPGDYLFQWIGVPPWTKGHNTGVHLPVVIGLFLLLIGGIGTIRVYRHKYPKIRLDPVEPENQRWPDSLEKFWIGRYIIWTRITGSRAGSLLRMRSGMYSWKSSFKRRNGLWTGIMDEHSI